MIQPFKRNISAKAAGRGFLFAALIIPVIFTAGCGNDSERKIEVTIKDTSARNDATTQKSSSSAGHSDDSAAKQKMVSISLQDMPINRIIDMVTRIQPAYVKYPDWFREKKMSLTVMDKSVEDILKIIAIETDTELFEEGDAFILREKTANEGKGQ